MLNSSVAVYGDKRAFLSKPKGGDNYYPISFNQFGGDVHAFGTALMDLDLQGKKIVIIGENKYEWSISYLASVCGTGIVVPLDRKLPQHEIQNLILRSEASAVIFSGGVAEKILGIVPALKTVKYFVNMDLVAESGEAKSFAQILEKGHQLVNQGDTRFKDAAIDNEAVSILLFTSGRTDSSKAVMLSHKNICTNLMAQCSMLKITPDDIFLSVLPIHHTYECTCGFLCPLYRGATVAYCEGLRQIPEKPEGIKGNGHARCPLIYQIDLPQYLGPGRKKG